MRIVRTDTFKRDFQALSAQLKRRTEQALRFLLSDPHHPSLHTKRIRGTRNYWEARVTRSHRLIFTMEADAYTLYAVGPHDIVDRFARGHR